ncbi:PREDICTED: uncharacterized protein LOC109115470 [Nelumbo nucifera]|uniref:Uncharacterized protein LOC109115470 n=1 Tax=Nelumbo nucifera TaxID=4432 RepID=A0A1U8QAK7_NELNU|nr:PREDICTED: uncharacterized protein LOC109115470 [Nelumbo nucifera]
MLLRTASISSGMITTVKLDGTNFLEWSQSAKLTITGRGKLGFITRREVKSSPKDPKFVRWEQDNSLVMSWLICSMQPHIARNYMFLPYAKDIWNGVVATYSQVNNTARVDQRREACNMRQGERFVATYFSSLQSIWEEMDHLKSLVWKDPKDGLNPEFDFTRQHILSAGVVSLATAYSLVQGEESRRTAMMQSSVSDHSAFISSRPKQNTSKHPIVEKVEDVICEYCKKPRHTKERCWKLNPHLKPEKYKTGKKGNAHLATIGNDAQPLDVLDSSNVMDKLRNILLQLEKGGTSSSSGSRLSNLSSSYAKIGTALACSTSFSPWVVDSRASAHMTGMPSHFTSYKLTLGKGKITDLSMGKTIGSGHEVGGVYLLDGPSEHGLSSQTESYSNEKMSLLKLWHRRLGHMSINSVNPSLQGENASEDRTPFCLPIPTSVLPSLPTSIPFPPSPPSPPLVYRPRSWQQFFIRRSKRVAPEAECPSLSDSPNSGNLEPPDNPIIDSNLDLPIAIRKGKRTCSKYPITNYVSYDALSPSYCAYISAISSVSSPRSVTEAMHCPHSKEAMNQEMEALMKNQTWEVVPKDKILVGCKWRSKKQSVVARSSAEVGYRAMAHGVSELLWLKTLLTEMGIQADVPMRLYCDNQAAINIAHNPVQHGRTKHIEVDRHFTRERIASEEICLPFVRLENQLADCLTKSVHHPKFAKNLAKLCMIDIYVQLEGGVENG